MESLSGKSDFLAGKQIQGYKQQCDVCSKQWHLIRHLSLPSQLQQLMLVPSNYLGSILMTVYPARPQGIVSKANRRLYFLKQLKTAGVPPHQLLHFYTTVIHPVLEYASLSGTIPSLVLNSIIFTRRKNRKYKQMEAGIIQRPTNGCHRCHVIGVIQTAPLHKLSDWQVHKIINFSLKV